MAEAGDDPGEQPLSVVLEQVEKRVILNALNNNQWHRERAARALGISLRSLYRRMAHYGLAKQ